MTNIGELCDKFEKEAKALGYEVEALALYNKKSDRHQINWNDKIEDEHLSDVCQNVAMALWKVARDDEDTVISAISWGRALKKNMADSLEIATQGMLDGLSSLFSAGLEAGSEMVKERLEAGDDDRE